MNNMLTHRQLAENIRSAVCSPLAEQREAAQGTWEAHKQYLRETAHSVDDYRAARQHARYYLAVYTMAARIRAAQECGDATSDLMAEWRATDWDDLWRTCG